MPLITLVLVRPSAKKKAEQSKEKKEMFEGARETHMIPTCHGGTSSSCNQRGEKVQNMLQHGLRPEDHAGHCKVTIPQVCNMSCTHAMGTSSMSMH